MDDVAIQYHRRDCPLYAAEEIVGCGCPVIREQATLDLDSVPPPGVSDPMKVYEVTARRTRPIHWYEDMEQAENAWGLPEWVQRPEWPGESDRPAYVVMRRMKVHREDPTAEFYGLIPVSTHPRQKDAVDWALADISSGSS